MEMSEDHGQDASLVPVRQHITRQIAQLGLVDHLKAAVDEWTLRSILLNCDLSFHEQIVLDEFCYERSSLLSGGLELLTEIERRLTSIGWCYAVKQRLSLSKVSHKVARGIETKGKLTRFRRQLGQNEGIPSRIGGNVKGVW